MAADDSIIDTILHNDLFDCFISGLTRRHGVHREIHFALRVSVVKFFYCF